jgi:predicted component of type VI protein secretion system
MGRVIVVEVLGKSGNVAHRVRLDGSAAVGRAYDNDVIVDDPFVDAHALHITASEDGAIVVRDLGTTNGVFASDGTRLGESVSLHAGDVLRMGRTRIRVMRADSPVPPTLADSEGRLRAMTSNRASASGPAPGRSARGSRADGRGSASTPRSPWRSPACRYPSASSCRSWASSGRTTA